MKSKLNLFFSFTAALGMMASTFEAKAETQDSNFVTTMTKEPYSNLHKQTLASILSLGVEARVQGGWETAHVIVKSLSERTKGTSLTWRGPFENENLQKLVGALGAHNTLTFQFARPPEQAQCFDKALTSEALYDSKIAPKLAALKVPPSSLLYAIQIKSDYKSSRRYGDVWNDSRYYRFFVLAPSNGQKPIVLFSLEEIRNQKYCYLGNGFLVGNEGLFKNGINAFQTELTAIKQSINTANAAERNRRANTKSMWAPASR